VLPDWGKPFSFDAETAAAIIADYFTITEVIRWDTPALHFQIPLTPRAVGQRRSMCRRGSCVPVMDTSLDCIR
jgi:hypothetical protein